MTEQILLQKKKEKQKLEQGSKEWEESVSVVAELLEKNERNKWAIGDEAIQIPSSLSTCGSHNPKIKNTPLEDYAEDVGKKIAKLYRKKEDYYSLISKCRRVSRAFPIQKRIPELTWGHHFLALLIKKPELRQEKLKLCLKQQMNSSEFYEYIKEMYPDNYSEHEELINLVTSKYLAWQDALTELEEANDKVLAKIEQEELDTILRNLFVFTHSRLPRIVELLVEYGGKLDPNFKEMINKGGINET